MAFEEQFPELARVNELKSAAIRLAIARTDDLLKIPLQERRGLPDPMIAPEVVAAFNAYHLADRELAGRTSSFDYAPDDLV